MSLSVPRSIVEKDQAKNQWLQFNGMKSFYKCHIMKSMSKLVNSFIRWQLGFYWVFHLTLNAASAWIWWLLLAKYVCPNESGSSWTRSPVVTLTNVNDNNWGNKKWTTTGHTNYCEIIMAQWSYWLRFSWNESYLNTFHLSLITIHNKWLHNFTKSTK